MLDFARRTLHYKREFDAWQARYNAQAPKAGELAPDFTLSDATGANQVQLSSFQGEKPVALVFGSFT
jgi:hypothetical protein